MLQKINSAYTAVLLNIQTHKITSTDTLDAVTAGTDTPREVAAGTVDNRETSGTVAASWDTKFVDTQRQQYHDQKMASKVHRPATQLRVLGIDAGTVLHETVKC